MNLSDGHVRLPTADAEPGPDGALKVRIQLFPLAATFRTGHRIRLQVSSAAHPRYARNPGTGEPVAGATELRVADQEVFHDPDHASLLLLPIVG